MSKNSSVHAFWYGSLRDPAFPSNEYEALVDRHPSSTPYNRLAWLQGAELAATHSEVLVLRRESQLVACIPVIWEKRAGARIARHLGAPLSDRIGLMVEDNDPGLVAACLRLVQRRRPIAYIELNELYDGEGGVALTREFARRYCLAVHEHPTCRVPVFELPNERPTDMDLPQRIRTDLRRKRRLTAEAGATLHRITPTPENSDWLDQIITVERASWKGSAGVGVFSLSDRERWLRCSLRNLAANGQVRVVALMLEGQMISYRLGLLEKGRLYDYNCAFIPRYSRIASGRLLIDEFVQWGADEGWTAIDASRISRHTDRHLMHERMNASVQQYRVRYFSKRPSGIIAHWAQSLWTHLKALLRRIDRHSRRDLPQAEHQASPQP